MFENSDAFDLFISELFDEKLRILSATDGQYAALKSKAAREAETLEGDFTKKEFTLIEDFHGLLCDIDAIENRFLYRQGYLDCVKLLKTLGVLV